MIVNLSEAASNVMLDAIAAMMDGGTIELLSSNGTPLAVLRLSNPAAGDAVGGTLAFNKIAEGDAVTDGRAEFARVVASDGSEVFRAMSATRTATRWSSSIPCRSRTPRRCGSTRSGCRCRE
jgi:hypothetical protein